MGSAVRTSVLWAIHRLQRPLVLVSYTIVHLLRLSARPHVVVGTEEIASVLHDIAQAVPPTISVCLRRPVYYDHHYDHDYGARRMRGFLMGPLLLGYLAARHTTFVHVGGSGFLVPVDGREFELRFLSRRGKRVVCVFTGSEIRSHELLGEFGRRQGRDVITTYQSLTMPGIDSPRREAYRRELARTADAYATEIINPAVDQMSHLTRPTHPFLYFTNDDEIAREPDKWRDLRRPVLLHAPTSPLIKGTPLVRSTVAKLRSEGYEFEYVEVIGRPHTEVVDELRRAHIVLNQFYAFVPGVLGMEALAANAVMVCSADPAIETGLPAGAEQAWVVTPAWELPDRLRVLLDHPERLQAQADRGTEWVAAHASRSASAERLRSLLA